MLNSTITPDSIRPSEFVLRHLPRLWFLAKNKAADAKRGFRDRRKQTLFIDARNLGTLIDKEKGQQRQREHSRKGIDRYRTANSFASR